MATDKNTLKNWFKTGLKPVQEQFWAWMDSYWHKDEKIPITAINDIEGILDAKADAEALTNHLTDADAHAALFEAKENTENKGIVNGYAPLNELAKIAAVYLNIVDDLTTGGATALASAETVKTLKGLIDGINTLLGSDNVNLDNVQELVDAIETIQLSLSTILVNDLNTGGTTKALTAEQGKVLKELIDNFEVLPPTLQEVLDRIFGEDQRGQAGRGLYSYLTLLQEDGDGNVSSDFRMSNPEFTRYCYLWLYHDQSGLLGIYDNLVAEFKILEGLASIRQKVGLNETVVDFETPIANTNIKYPAKPAGNYTLATTDDLSALGGAAIVTKTKAEIDTLISTNALVPLTVYEITGVDIALYGGTTIYLQAINTNTLALDGIGKFYNPKYDQSVSGFNVWTSAGTYSIGSKVHWGGKTWTNLTGAVGTAVDIFTLSSAWSVIAFNSSDYNVVYDAIRYDYNSNVIVYRNEKNTNIVSTSFNNIAYWATLSLYNPIKAFMWGNVYNQSTSKGIGNQKINDSYNENINFRGMSQVYFVFTNKCYQSNVTFNSNASQFGIILENDSKQTGLVFSNYSVQYYVTLKNSCNQSNLTFDKGSEQYNVVLNNESSQTNLNFNNYTKQQRVILDNKSSQTNWTETIGYSQNKTSFSNYTYNRTSKSMTSNETGLMFQGDLPIYADNAAALAAGLPIGVEYRTSTGVKMITY